MNIYICLGVLFGLIAAMVVLSWYLSFIVPNYVENVIEWIWENKKALFSLYYIFMFGVILVSIIMFTIPSIVMTESPISQTGVFLYASSVLLVSNFFITKSLSQYNRNYDSHPLLFQTVVFFLAMAFLTGVVDSTKIYRLSKRCSL